MCTSALIKYFGGTELKNYTNCITDTTYSKNNIWKSCSVINQDFYFNNASLLLCQKGFLLMLMNANVALS